jgi:hypothetical protein
VNIEELLSSDELAQIVVGYLTPPVTGPVIAMSVAMTMRLQETYREATKERLEGLTIDQVGEQVSNHQDEPSRPSMWVMFKEEFHLLLCTNDPKYNDVRKGLGGAAGKSQTAIISMVSAAVAVNLGMIAATAVPLSALCLLAIARMGKNAFCNKMALFVPVIEPSKEKESKVKKRRNTRPKKTPATRR